jgi:uncharacterized protein YaaW (UPF0174 family)
LSHDLLIQRLQSLNDEDLHSILCAGLRVPEKKLGGLSHDELVLFGSIELRYAAGSSTLSLTRKPHTFPYKQLLIDVADKLSPGITPLSWTKFRLNDEHEEEEIERVVLDLFEEQVRKWWSKLPAQKREEFVNGINSVLRAEQDAAKPIAGGVAPFLQKQALEQLIQGGLIAGLAKVSAGGLLGVAGVSIVGQLGWIILLQTVGWMAGIKIALFGIGGYGAAGGAVAWLGASAIGTAIALPGLVALADGPAYRKTVPTTIMILARSRINQFTDNDSQ